MQDDDRFVARLKEQRAALEACQKEHGLESCMPCDKTLECTLRAEYVKSVYDSMSKGETGGFEF